MLASTVVYDSKEFENTFEQYAHSVKKHDSYWYQSIADEGYAIVEDRKDIGYSDGSDFHQSNWAFFPFYPVIIQATRALTGWSYNTSAFWWSLLLSTLSMLVVYWFGTYFFEDPNRSFFATLLLFAFPFGFYFSMFYTEAIYITLAVGAFLCIHHRKWLALSVVLIPLVLLRPNGLIAMIPLYLYHLEVSGLLEKYRVDWSGVFSRKNLLRSAAFITGIVAFAGWCVYQYIETGYFFAFGIAQEGWYRELSFPLMALFRQGNVMNQFNSWYAIAVILFAVYAWRKLPISLNVLVWFSILFPMSSDLIHSMTRYISVVFPLFFVFGAILYKTRFRYGFIAVFFALQLVTYYFWLIEHPISY